MVVYFIKCILFSVTREFEVLLEDQAPLESYIEWLDSMVDQCVVQVSKCYIFVYCIHFHTLKSYSVNIFVIEYNVFVAHTL